MAISKVKVSEDAHRLMLAIGEAIRLHTSQSPISGEQIVGVLGSVPGRLSFGLRTPGTNGGKCARWQSPMWISVFRR